jgi:sortase A
MPVQSGAPFKHIDRFRPGDLISIWTADGRFDYSVVSSGVTTPSDVPVIDQRRRTARLTLTTSHPEFSARERLYVQTVLVRSTKSA